MSDLTSFKDEVIEVTEQANEIMSRPRLDVFAAICDENQELLVDKELDSEIRSERFTSIDLSENFPSPSKTTSISNSPSYGTSSDFDTCSELSTTPATDDNCLRIN